MNPLIQLCLATFLLSFVLTYGAWVWIRVLFLRANLFNIRDRMWSEMHASHSLGDGEYQDTRSVLNTLIRIAPLLSFPMLATMLLDGLTERHAHDATTLNPAVAHARRKIVSVLLNYMMYESASGIMLSAISRIYADTSKVHWQIRKWLQRFMDSEEVQQIEVESDVPILA